MKVLAKETGESLRKPFLPSSKQSGLFPALPLGASVPRGAMSSCWLLSWVCSPVLCRGSGLNLLKSARPNWLWIEVAVRGCTLRSRGSKPGVDAEPRVLISHGGGCTGSGASPGRGGTWPSLPVISSEELFIDLLGGVIHAFISGVPELTVLARRSSVFTWQCWKSN